MASSTTPTAGPALLGQLLSETFAYCKAHVVSLGIGALVFGVVLGAFFGYAEKQAMVLGGMQGGVDTAKMEELSARIEAGDETALAELEAAIPDFPMDDTAMGNMNMDAMLMTVLPIFGIGILLSVVISWAAHAYYVLVAVEGKDASGTLARLGSVMLPLVGVSLWSMIRSWVWVPLVVVLLSAVSPQLMMVLAPVCIVAAIVLSLVFYPRFVAAPLIYLAEGKGITASVASSFDRTKGYWSKIVGNMIVASLIMMLVSIVLGMVLGLIFMLVPLGATLASNITQQVSMAVITVFTVRLSHTIVQHPRA